MFTFKGIDDAMEKAKSFGSGGTLVPDEVQEEDVVRLGMLGKLEWDREPSIGGATIELHLKG